MIPDHVREEIQEAIRKATRVPARIRVLNTRPRFRYVFTCHRCGSHNYSLVHVSGGWGDDPIKVCSICGGMGNGNAGFEQELERRRRMREQGDRRTSGGRNGAVRPQPASQNRGCRSCSGHRSTTFTRNGNVFLHDRRTCFCCGGSTWRSRQWWR